MCLFILKVLLYNNSGCLFVCLFIFIGFLSLLYRLVFYL